MTYLSLWLFWLLANSRVGVCRTLSGVNNPTNPTNPISNSESIWQQNKDRFSGTNNTTSNSSPMANLTDTDDPDDRDNCQGSWYCNHSPLLPWHKRPTRKMCEFAYERYDVNLYYLGLNTRYYGTSSMQSLDTDVYIFLLVSDPAGLVESCLAIIDCFPTAELSGYSIQKAFVQIREHGCERCGSHYFVSTTTPQSINPPIWNYQTNSSVTWYQDPQRFPPRPVFRNAELLQRLRGQRQG